MQANGLPPDFFQRDSQGELFFPFSTEEAAARRRLEGLERNFKWAKERYIRITPQEELLKNRLRDAENEAKSQAKAQFNSGYKQLFLNFRQGYFKIIKEQEQERADLRLSRNARVSSSSSIIIQDSFHFS